MLPADANPPPNNLPNFLTSFIGREDDVAQVKQEMSTARLLTLTGPGGCGKTRLALKVAAELLAEFRDGAWWCDLAAVTDPAYVAQTIRSALRLAERADRSALDSLTSALGSRQALLVLDNCEHLLAGCAALGLAVLHSCPGVRILATSLQRLGLPQERVWPVPPLTLPEPAEADLGVALEHDAVRLFVERAARAWPSFRLAPVNRRAVIAICRQLDGLPLAIELAAARARLLTVDQIAGRLDDAFGLLTRGSLSSLPRHQTLRLAIDWSYQFLSEDERVLLRRLAVFAGPFTLSMAEAVCGDETGSAVVLDLLDGLADKSFVALLPRGAEGEAHCRLLEVIRQYARERLEESGEAARVRDRYLDWCMGWAEQAANGLTGPGRSAWLAQFASRQEHFRAALRWACTSPRAEAGLRLAGALGRFWMTSGLSEGRAWLDELLGVEAAARATGASVVPDRVRAWALMYSGRLAERQGDPAQGLRRGEESLALFRAIDNGPGCLASLNLLALAAQDTNDYERAEACYAEALTLSHQLRDDRMTSVLLINQGLMYYEQQDYRRAAPIWDEAYTIIKRLGDDSIASRDNLACLAMMQGNLAHAQDLLESELERLGQSGDTFGLAILKMDLGEVARRQGDFDRAQNLLGQALERQQQLGDQFRFGETLANLGSLARNRGDLQAAKARYEQSLASLESTGYTRLASHVKTCLGVLAAALARDDEALVFFQEGLQIAFAGRHLLGRVEALEGIAGVLARRGDAQRAARWLAVTEAARETLGAPVAPVERESYDRITQRLLGTLGAETYAALRAGAAGLSLEQMIVETLGSDHDGTAAPPRAAMPVTADLRVLALGATRVFAGQVALEQGDWTYAKSKELLFYLLSRGPATKAQIGLDLWPDASPNQLRAAFHSVLHHLRRALGRADWIVHAGGEYSFNGDLPLDYDVRSFEKHLRQAQLDLKAAAQPAGRSRVIAHLEAAAALWRGDFLADTEAGDWAVYEREALRQAFFGGLLQLADLRFSEANYTQAAQSYRRALVLDSYLELAHRGLMRCYARQGEAGRAVRHYQDLRQLLQQELSTAPSSETTLLYDRIRRGDDI
jgi:predicted ATPase/DNA-binding SARP family transcriptional activator